MVIQKGTTVETLGSIGGTDLKTAILGVRVRGAIPLSDTIHIYIYIYTYIYLLMYVYINT